MAQEIERKFLVKGNFKPEVFKSTRIMQGYLSSVPERTLSLIHIFSITYSLFPNAYKYKTFVLHQRILYDIPG